MEGNDNPKKDGNKKETDPNMPTAKQDEERRQTPVSENDKTKKKTDEPEVWIKKEETPTEPPIAKQWDTTAGSE